MKNLLILLGVAIIMIVGFITYGLMATVLIAASGAGAFYLLKNLMNKQTAPGMGGGSGMGGWY